MKESEEKKMEQEKPFTEKLKEREYEKDIPEGNVIKGLMWAALFSIPLWISFFGWVKLIRSWIG
jgi:hypothetical protein